MIDRITIDKIFDAARIEEVVGDFVVLKKRGANLLGLCPFHNEKTPSFTVSPAKGIYKCFGCAKSGNAVGFIMEHEQLSYPEALKYLAKKYSIEIEEEPQTPEDVLNQNFRESLFVACSYAQKYFSETLFDTEEGKAIGLSYLKERGFSLETIQKFQLGYSIDKRTEFTDTAMQNGHQLETLIKSGLTSSNEHGNYDRFAARVMFPIHNVSGRVIGFGGRTLKTDKKVAKYVNSPETEIYHKSNVLYGLFFAKRAIIQEDHAFLVEGYTDVISLHQAGIENVIASSGTSLTVEQIRLIKRYTPNITILYDGDDAGIKASFRGIDLILQEGMNVRTLLFPDGEDPDSFARRTNTIDLKEFIKRNTKDFIAFKTSLLLKETDNDPIKKAGLIKEMIETVALVADPISRSLYLKECSRVMNVDEQILINELNRIRRKKSTGFSEAGQQGIAEGDSAFAFQPVEEPVGEKYSVEESEQKIIQILLNYSSKKIFFETEDEEGIKSDVGYSVAEFLISELNNDNITFENPLYQMIFDEVGKSHEEGFEEPNLEKHFINHSNTDIAALAIELIVSFELLSINWENKHKIIVQTEENNIKQTVLEALYYLKFKKLRKMINECQKELEVEKDEEKVSEIMQKIILMEELKKQLGAKLGISIF